MASFRIKNIEICMSEMFLFALLLLEKITEEKVMICLVSACFIHEMGHIFALCMLNEKISKIKFTVAGILIVPSNKLKKFSTEIVILFFGPLFNIISGLLIFQLDKEAGCFSILTGCFHMMPLQMLDGGKILLNVFSMRSGSEKAEKMAVFINNVSILIILIFLLVFQIKNVALYLIFALNVKKMTIFKLNSTKKSEN